MKERSDETLKSVDRSVLRYIGKKNQIYYLTRKI